MHGVQFLSGFTLGFRLHVLVVPRLCNISLTYGYALNSADPLSYDMWHIFYCPFKGPL